MTVESLMQRCAELGIRLTLKSDDTDRLVVDAPKGTLTAPLREALTAHKPDLIAILKTSDQEPSITQVPTHSKPSEAIESQAPARTWNSPEATHLISGPPLSVTHAQLGDPDVEVKKLLSGGKYDAGVIDPKDPAARQIIAAQLIAALGGRNSEQYKHARRAFIDHGYLDETSKQLRTGDSPAERAAAARKLGVVRSPMATAHLIASLHDSAPEVRRSATESLGQLGDPAAIPSLNELLMRETSRQLPEAVIRHAINSIAVTQARSPATSQTAPPLVEKPAATSDEEKQEPVATASSKKQKHEIFAEYLSSFEREALGGPASSVLPATNNGVDTTLDATAERLRLEEEALRRAAEALDQKRIEAEAARRIAEDEARIKSEREAQARLEVEARIRAEEEARRRMAEEAARQRAEEEARVRAEQEVRSRAEDEARRRAEEETQFRLEAETLRKAAEELARKRSEAEAARKLAEGEAIRKATEEAKRRAEEEARTRAEEEVRRKAEEEVRLRVEEEIRRRAEEEAQARAADEAHMRAAVEARIRAEADLKRKAEEELRHRAEEEAQALAVEEARIRAAVEARMRAEEYAKRHGEDELRARAAEEAHRAAEDARLRQEAEERQRAEEARLLVDQDTLMQVAAELSRRRAELDGARQKVEAEPRSLVGAQERGKSEEESRRQIEAERHRDQLERKRLADEALLAESLRRAAEKQDLAAEQARIQAEEHKSYLTELDSVKRRLEEDARRRSEQERHIKAEIFALSKAEEEQRLRIEAEIKRRSEAVARLKEQEARADEETRRTAEEIRSKTEAHARRRAEVEAQLKEEEARLQAEQEAHVKAEEEARRLAEESRLRAQQEAGRRAEAEARFREEQARLQAEQEARIKADEEAHRLAEETRQIAEEIRLRAEEEARRRSEVQKQLKEEEARIQAEQEARLNAEAEAQLLADEIRTKAEEEARVRVEAEARLREEKAQLQAQAEAQRFADAVRSKAKEEALLQEEQARLQEVEDTRSQNQLLEVDLVVPEPFAAETPWVASSDQDEHILDTLALDEDPVSPIEEAAFASPQDPAPTKGLDRVFAEKGITSAEDDAGIPSEVLKRLNSAEASERVAALSEVVQVGGDDAFHSISRAFDDQVVEVRNAAARALYDLNPDRAATFTRALREGSTERRRKIGQALAASGLAAQAVGNLTGESREKTYDAFSLLFLMAKAGEVHPLMQAIEEYPNVEVRIAVVKLLALSGQPEIVPAFRRLAVRGSLPSEVRSAVMEAIYQISSQARESAPSAA